MSQHIRYAQIKELVAELRRRQRQRPLIVMGDFNCDWGKQSPLTFLSEQLQLSAYKKQATDLTTFPTLNQRIDWILISRHFRFVSYQVASDRVLSDHRAVTAVLEFN